MYICTIHSIPNSVILLYIKYSFGTSIFLVSFVTNLSILRGYAYVDIYLYLLALYMIRQLRQCIFKYKR